MAVSEFMLLRVMRALRIDAAPCDVRAVIRNVQVMFRQPASAGAGGWRCRWVVVLAGVGLPDVCKPDLLHVAFGMHTMWPGVCAACTLSLRLPFGVGHWLLRVAAAPHKSPRAPHD